MDFMLGQPILIPFGITLGLLLNACHNLWLFSVQVSLLKLAAFTNCIGDSTIYVLVMSLLEGPKAERQANRLAHLKTAIFLWHSCWIFPLFSQWTRPQGTIFNLTKFPPRLRVHGQIYIHWGNFFSSFCFLSTWTKFGDGWFWVLKTTGDFIRDMGQSHEIFYCNLRQTLFK